MNIDGPDLEDRYRRVLRLLPGYYRERWEDDMVAAYLDSRMTGDPDEDEYIYEFGRLTWPEAASVASDGLPPGGPRTCRSNPRRARRSSWPACWPKPPPGHPAAHADAFGFLITVPAADVAVLTAVTTQAYDSAGAVDISVAGKTRALPMAMAPLTHGQFTIALPSRNEALRLQRILAPSD